MRYRGDASDRILDRFARRLMAEGDPAPVGGAAPVAEPTAAPPGADVAAPAPGVVPEIVVPPSLLGDEPPAPEPAPPETEEQKAARLAAETPEQKAEREKAEGEAKAAARVPYDALKLPEGMPADQPAFAAFKDQALELGVEPEKAQKLIDTVAPQMKEALEAPYNQWAETVVEWVRQCKEDKEFGGADFEKNLAFASQFIDKIGGSEAAAVRKALNFTGAGNNPDMVRFLVRAGKAMQEATPIVAKPAAPEPASVARRAYPSMTQPTS